MGRTHPNIINLKDVESRSESRGSRFGYSSKSLASETGSKGLGCTWYEIPPGRVAFPYHYHCSNDEGLFILEGEGELRLGDQKLFVHAGDYISFPPGPDHAHSLKNSSSRPLRCICISTMACTDVVAYPDSKKISAWGSGDMSKGLAGTWVRAMMKEQAAVDYYDGEDIG